MKRQQRALLAMTTDIRAELVRRQQGRRAVSAPPVDQWESLIQLTRRIERVERLGWHRAAARLAEEQRDEAGYLRPQLDAWLTELRTRPTLHRLPPGRELFQDLEALEAEFGEVNCDWDSNELFVTTDEIQLEGIALGRFDIRLNWAALGEATLPYRIVARDPHPAGRNEDVTHPHVRDEALCAGNGRSAIDRALADWRLYDFFLTVNQILLTYSVGNAHVELEDWGGILCQDCGSSVDSDDRYHCQGCDCDCTLCGDCATSCRACGSNFCSECTTTCGHCSENHCSSCLSVCDQCQAAVCSDCREHETLCSKCHEREQAAVEQEEPVEEPARRIRRARAAV
jgi:hypothetical protein